MIAIALLCLAICTIVTGLPAPSPSINYEDPTIGRTPAQNACAVASAYAQEAIDSGTLEYYPYVPASTAIDCLLTVPFNATDGLLLLESLKPYLQWQSTLAYLKNPPPDYWREPHDLLGSLQDMIDNINRYDSQYRFELDLYMRVSLAYDGHLRYTPKLLFDLLAFGRPYTLISVSQDGLKKPKVYYYDELIKQVTTFQRLPQPIVKIDDHDVDYVMDQTAKWAVSHDLDAAYNQVFFSLSQGALGYMGNGAGIWAGGGRGQTLYPGDFTTLEWANGSRHHAENYARAMVSFENITTGQDLYDRYLVGYAPFTADRLEPASGQDPLTGQQSNDSASTLQGPPGFPQPIVNLAGNSMGGYYMKNHPDAAVLSLQSFGAGWDAVMLRDAITNFLRQAKADGKARLIIDVSANGGGYVDQVYSVFRTLFPDIEPYAAARLRALDDINLLGQAVTTAVGSDYPWDYDYPPGPGMLLNNYLATPLIGQADLDDEGNPFKSWADKFGPHEFHGDNFTSLMQWNMSDRSGAPNLFQPNGYGNRTNVFSERPFEAEDMVILTDGYCASACNLFVELLTQQAKVKTVTVGGRPGAEGAAVGPMQAVGGVRGANVYTYQLISSLTDGAPYLLPNSSSVEQIAAMKALAANYTQLPMERGGGGSVNVRDLIREGNEEQTPLQFVYQPADCRIFYQAYHTFDIATLWDTTFEVAWEGGQCAYGQGYVAPRAGGGNDTEMGLLGKRGDFQLSDPDQLGYQWKKLVTEVHRIKDMGAFQMP